MLGLGEIFGLVDNEGWKLVLNAVRKMRPGARKRPVNSLVPWNLTILVLLFALGGRIQLGCVQLSKTLALN